MFRMLFCVYERFWLDRSERASRVLLGRALSLRVLLADGLSPANPFGGYGEWLSRRHDDDSLLILIQGAALRQFCVEATG